MANFDVNSEAVLKQVEEAAKAAKKVSLTADKLASQSETSFHYEDGDVLTIPAQVAQVVPLTGNILERLASDAPRGYFAFQAYVTRGGKQLPVRISAKQLFAPTVWAEAQQWEEDLYEAEFATAKKRFGEHGSLTLINGVPYLGNEIRVKLTLSDVFTSVFVDENRRSTLPEKHTALRKREQYAMADE